MMITDFLKRHGFEKSLLKDGEGHIKLPSSNIQKEVRISRKKFSKGSEHGSKKVRRVTDANDRKNVLGQDSFFYDMKGVLVKEQGFDKLENYEYLKGCDAEGRIQSLVANYYSGDRDYESKHHLPFNAQEEADIDENLVNTVTRLYHEGNLFHKIEIWPNGQEFLKDYDDTRSEDGPWRSIMKTPLEGGVFRITVHHLRDRKLEGLEYTFTSDGEMEDVMYHPRSDLDDNENAKQAEKIQYFMKKRKFLDNMKEILFDKRSKAEQVIDRAERVEKKYYGISLNLNL